MIQGALKTINEVSEEVGVAQHVLRFWEGEFAVIKPIKRNRRRLYSPEDIVLLKRIKNLLYDQGYTIKVAKKIIRGKVVDNEQYVKCLSDSLSNLQEIYELIGKKCGM